LGKEVENDLAVDRGLEDGSAVLKLVPQGGSVDEVAVVGDGELSEEDMSQIQLGEGETLEEIKAKLKPKKSNISAEMLDTANSYDDKVALVRMIVAEDAARVASVLKGMIRSGM
jgi:hypothetical protein